MNHLSALAGIWSDAITMQLAYAAVAAVVGAFALRRALHRPALRAVRADESVLITGAGTGIGAACAAYLVDVAGFRVYAGVLSEAEGIALRATVKHPELLVPLVLDVTNQEHIDSAVKTVTAASGGRGLFGLLSNAGIISLQGPVERTELAVFRRVMEVNYLGAVAVTKAFLPLIKQAGGRILILSSMGGRYAGPFMASYLASKYALEAFIDVLRRETCYLGIKVVGIQPATMKTEMVSRQIQFIESVQEDAEYVQFRNWLRMMHNQMLTGGAEPQVIAEVVDQALRVKEPKIRYQAGGMLRVMQLLASLPDSWADWLQRQAFSALPRDDIKLL
eukprot:TRINITY_DN23113_c0_g1_i1.p1 TRINITY_DN23113_c0_g1~~TRINITY_DN23113_c0_g1_i1.p1  ORF type:complete len:334 (-),score=54.27 TRINITY_DN23113_c0_g1_i1:136-1137(-)